MTVAWGTISGMPCLVLLAARELADFGRRRESVEIGQVVGYLMVAAVLVALVCLSIYAATRFAHWRRYHSHGALFGALCRLHGLDHSARRLLRRVARHHRLRHPARVFTEPNWLDPAALPASFRPDARRLLVLRNWLFRQSSDS